jgi:hypothetical protein
MFESTRKKLATTVEEYAHQRRRRRWFVNRGANVPQYVKRRVIKASRESRTALDKFLGEANSFHANVPDLGPH